MGVRHNGPVSISIRTLFDRKENNSAFQISVALKRWLDIIMGYYTTSIELKISLTPNFVKQPFPLRH